MEELRPEELEELVQELEGESGDEEPLSPEVEALLRDLGPWSPKHTRRDAAEQLGRRALAGRVRLQQAEDQTKENTGKTNHDQCLPPAGKFAVTRRQKA